MSAVQVWSALARDRNAVNLLPMGRPLHLVVCPRDSTEEADTPSPLVPPPSPPDQELVSATATRLLTGKASTSDLQVVPREGGGHVVVFSPKASEKEDYLLSVLCRGEHVEGSPFLLRCVEPPLLTLDHTAKRSAIVDVTRPVHLVLPLDKVGVAEVSEDVSARVEGPSGKCEAEVRLHSMPATGVGRDVSVCFVPREPGAYSVCVTRGGEELSSSPCLVMADSGVEEALKCHIFPEDQRLFEQTLPFSPVGQTVHSFHVSTEGVSNGSRSPNDFTVHCSGPAEARVAISTDPEGVDMCEVVPSAPGDYQLSVLWRGQHVRGSPCLMRFREGRIDSGGLHLDQEEFLLGEPHHFTLNCSELEVVPEVSCSSDTACEIDVSSVPERECRYRCKLLPLQTGTYDVTVKCQGRHIDGSPFCVQFKDPQNPPPPSSPSGNPATLTSSETLAPSSPPSLSTLSKSPAPSNSTTGKISTPSTPPSASSASPPTPSAPPLLPNSLACQLVGGSADHKTGGTLSFRVSTQGAGPGTLTASAQDPDSKDTIPLTTTCIADNLYQLDFDPGDRPLCDLCVTFDGRHIPGSPFRLTLSDPDKFKLSGEGLVGGRVGQWNTFVVTAMAPPPGELQVRVEQGDGLKAKSEVLAAGGGRFGVRYLPPVSGDYKIWVNWGQIPVPGSPFSVRCSSTLYQVRDAPRRVCAGMLLEFEVQLVGGGCPELDESPQVICRTSSGRSQKGRVSLVDMGQHIYHCSLTPRQHGNLTVCVIWNKIHVRGSPFTVKVLAPPRPELVRVHGAGVEEGGVVGEELPFIVETGRAGGGTLAIRVQGPGKGLKFKTCPDPSNKRTLHATYHPTVPGGHVIEVEWAGHHVPGSPFQVQVVRRHRPGVNPRGVALHLVEQGEESPDEEEGGQVDRFGFEKGELSEAEEEIDIGPDLGCSDSTPPSVSAPTLPTPSEPHPPQQRHFVSPQQHLTRGRQEERGQRGVRGGRGSVSSLVSSVSSSLHAMEQLDTRRDSEDQTSENESSEEHISIQLEDLTEAH